MESDALDKFIEDLEETLNKANNTVYHTFEEFANTVQSLIDEAALKDTSESLQKIVNLIAGNGTALVDGLETAITNTSVQATVTSDKENGNLVDISNVAENTRFIELLQSTNNIVSTMNDDIRGKLSDLYEKATSIDNNISTIANNNNFEVSVTNNYDSLLNVEGSVDAKVLSNLKEILEESYKYTSEKLIKDLNSLGFYRNQR